MSLDEKAFLAAVETARTKAEEDEAADRKREKKSKKVTLAPADPPIVTSPTASQKPSTSSSSSSSSSASSNGSNSTSPLTATGARLSEWGKLKDKRIDEARKKIIAEREEKELANASFKPDLSLTSGFRKQRLESETVNNANKVDSLLLRFSEWERAKNDRRADAQYEALLQEAAELTFSPEISKLSQQIESRLPDDIKSALRSVDGAYTDMPGGNYLDPETSFERREEILRNFLLRQAKGRAEREKKVDFSNPMSPRIPPSSPRYRPRTTIPVEPVFATAQRAAHHGGGGGGVSPLSQSYRQGGGVPSRGNYISGSKTPVSPMLVPLHSLPTATHSPALVVPGGSFSTGAVYFDRGGGFGSGTSQFLSDQTRQMGTDASAPRSPSIVSSGGAGRIVAQMAIKELYEPNLLQSFMNNQQR